MKRKPTRDIPDFSSKRTMKGVNPFQKVDASKQQPKPPSVAPNVKPPSTTSKAGGRRGG